MLCLCIRTCSQTKFQSDMQQKLSPFSLTQKPIGDHCTHFQLVLYNIKHMHDKWSISLNTNNKNCNICYNSFEQTERHITNVYEIITMCITTQKTHCRSHPTQHNFIILKWSTRATQYIIFSYISDNSQSSLSQRQRNTCNCNVCQNTR